MSEKTYEMSIYTWPAMRGVPCDCRRSFHGTPEAATTYLETQEKPYHHAVLSRQIARGMYKPCDWGGRVINASEKWPRRRGTNSEHPAYLALNEAWDSLVAQVRSTHAQQGGAMIDIANSLLAEQHPETCGWANKLAWEAAA